MNDDILIFNRKALPKNSFQSLGLWMYFLSSECRKGKMKNKVKQSRARCWVSVVGCFPSKQRSDTQRIPDIFLYSHILMPENFRVIYLFNELLFWRHGIFFICWPYLHLKNSLWILILSISILLNIARIANAVQCHS